MNSVKPSDPADAPEMHVMSVAVLGGRGAGAVVAFSLTRLQSIGRAACLGFLNDFEPVGSEVSGHPILGPFSTWRTLPQNAHFIAPLHKAKEMERRAQVITGLGIPRDRWANVIDPQALIAPDAILGVGIFVAPGAAIICGSRVGDHVVVRSKAEISHDCTVEDFVMVGGSAVVCGYSVIREGAHIAPGAIIRDGITVGRYSVVGLGAVVVHDVPDYAIVAGNPARVVGTVQPATSAKHSVA